MAETAVSCNIEHHAVLFALLAKRAVELCGEDGKKAILHGMILYGKERGRRMALNALARGEQLNTLTNQAYGEWKPDYDGQMEFGQICTEPSLRTYIARCAWCDAWKKHGLTEYGKLYCVHVDDAVYQGYQDAYVCTQITEPMSWGGKRCEFDWGCPLTPEENEALAAKKKELGTSCMKDFNFHTAHLKSTISRVLAEDLGKDGEKAAALALEDFAETFGRAYLDVLDTIPPEELYPGDTLEKSASAELKNGITSWLEEHEDEMIRTADFIFHHPETAYREERSSACLAAFLKENGFQVSGGTAGIGTAFTAAWGEGSPVIGFLAEYDALPGLGHACGHNLLGTGAAAAACALKAQMEKKGMQGTLRVYGCPAEETMSGKIVMNGAHVFDDLDIAVTWHPFDRNRVSNDIWQAQDIKNYTFHGVSAHASRSPEQGRSALDAAELMNVGVNYLREHVAGDVRMHYAYMDNGQPANVVPDMAKTNYYIRSSLRARTEDASRRVDDCARGAAIMTGTTVDIELVSSCKEMKIDRELTELYYEAMTKIPTPVYTQEELDFAEQVSREAGFDNGGEYFRGLEPLEDEPVPISIGTDASEVSHTVPLITLSAATMCRGTPLHHWAAAKQAGMSIGHKGMLYAARCMAEGTQLWMERYGQKKKTERK